MVILVKRAWVMHKQFRKKNWIFKIVIIKLFKEIKKKYFFLATLTVRNLRVYEIYNWTYLYVLFKYKKTTLENTLNKKYFWQKNWLK